MKKNKFNCIAILSHFDSKIRSAAGHYNLLTDEPTPQLSIAVFLFCCVVFSRRDVSFGPHIALVSSALRSPPPFHAQQSEAQKEG